MPNVMDYLEWRGDLTFTEAPLCEVDNLIFCLLSYVDLDGIVPSKENAKGITLREAAAEYFFSHPNTGTRPLGFIIPSDILTLFKRIAHTRRFRDLMLTNYVSELSEEKQTQFSALTVRLPGEQLFVAFRGTDDTVVGWKEDFNLSFMEEIPAQRRAAEYLEHLELTPDTVLYVGGHSKGGNLAVWGAIHACERVQRQIHRIYSNDGPGFSPGTINSETYRIMADRISLILPEDSLVGLLLDRDPRYRVVKSARKGVFQHDGLSWEVLGGRFIRADGLSPTGIRNDTVVRERISAMTAEEREELIHLVFTLLESTGAKTLTELHHGRVKAAISALRTFRNLPEADREAASYLWDKFLGKGPREKISQSGVKENKKERRSKGRIRVSFFPLTLP